MSEKIGGAKGTELDDEFCEMEKVCLTILLDPMILLDNDSPSPSLFLTALF